MAIRGPTPRDVCLGTLKFSANCALRLGQPRPRNLWELREEIFEDPLDQVGIGGRVVDVLGHGTTSRD